MTQIKSFQDILAWQRAHELVLLIYKITEISYPKSEEYCLKSQIRRCAISIPSNIAEGFKRRSKKDCIHFYNIADASLEELKYQTILSKDLHYFSGVQYHQIMELSNEVGKLLCGWAKAQKALFQNCSVVLCPA